MLIVHACGSQAMNPGGITLLGSPWSPPQWMKASPGKQGQEANTLDLSTPGAADAWVQYMVKCADLLLFYIYIYWIPTAPVSCQLLRAGAVQLR